MVMTREQRRSSLEALESHTGLSSENSNKLSNLAQSSGDEVVAVNADHRAREATEVSKTCCCWKDCKKVPKTSNSAAVLTWCNRRGCQRSVHADCAVAMLSVFGADAAFQKTACGKRCYNALMKQPRLPSILTKKHVPWHNDGPTPNVSYIGVLIDWLTDGNNYNRYRGGDAQSGESKTTIAGEIAAKIEAAGITTKRGAKDITNKIIALESLFRNAEDWRNATGQGRDHDDPSIREALLLRCSYYFELRDVMFDCASTRPQLLNTDEALHKDDTVDDSSLSREEESRSSESVRIPTKTQAKSTRASSTPILTTERPSKRQLTRRDPEVSSFIKLKESHLAQTRELQLQELEIRKQELEARRQQLDNESRAIGARIEESNAQAAKFRQESEHWLQQRKINLLRERTKLLNEGVPMSDIDALLPLSADL